MSVETPGVYDVEVLRTKEGLDALGPEWRELYSASDLHNPFLSYEWTVGCWELLPSGCRPFILTARHQGRLVGIAPLRLERRGGFRVLRFIGDGRSDYLGFLVSPEHPQAQEALLETLCKERRRWDLAVLRQLSKPYTGLCASAIPASLRVRGVEGTVAPYHACAGDWDTVCATGPHWLKNVRKRVRRFQQDGGTVTRYVGAEAAGRVPEVAAIERASWKGREGVGRFQSPESQRLLRQALEELGARDEMELWLAWMNGEPVAFEINFLATGRIWLYQGAYREDYRKYSPGAVLDFSSIERAWQAGAREYDFLSGDEAYKSERTSAERPLHYLALFPPTLRGYLAYTLLLAVRWRLKEYAPARAAFQFWVRRKSAIPAALSGMLRPGAAAR